MTKETWGGAILGAVLGSVIIPAVNAGIAGVRRMWRNSRPAIKLLQGIARADELCTIFVRDFFITAEDRLFSVEPRVGVGRVPNVHELWPDVEARAVAGLLNVFGQIGKSDNIKITRMSQDPGSWDSHVIVLGAQARKSLDFYAVMKNVAYRMDGDNIYDKSSNIIIEREDGYRAGTVSRISFLKRKFKLSQWGRS